MSNLGTKENPITTAKDGDRREKFCLCSRCKTVQQCMPSNDFYTTPNTGDDILCERCFASNHNLAYINPDRTVTTLPKVY